MEDSSNLNHAENEWPTHESPKFVETAIDKSHDKKEYTDVGIGKTGLKDSVDPAFDRFESFDIAHNDGEEDTEPIVIQPLTR